MKDSISIVIPAKNESQAIGGLLAKLSEKYPDYQIIVVNDGSSDNTSNIAKQHGADVIEHPYSIGNGAAIKSGARAAKGDYVLFMDADGQHNPDDIDLLISKMKTGFDMVVGARDHSSQANIFRGMANKLYNFIASKITGHKVEDLTSGFRIANRKLFCDFLYLLPNGFSYPTTITMAFFRSGYSIAYTSINANKRIGKSHINPLVDGMRFLIIILKVGSLYSPLKFFTPVSLLFFIVGSFNYLYTYFTQGTFTNMSALLIIASIFIFMFGLLSEMITVLTYAARKNDSGR